MDIYKLKKLPRLKLITDSEKLRLVDEFYVKLLTDGKTTSTILRSMQAYIDISILHPLSEIDKMYRLYKETKTHDRHKIRHGEQFFQDYITKLKARPKLPDIHNRFKTNYWTNNGYSIDEAKQKISDNAKQSSALVPSRKGSKTLCPNSIRYWLNLGYDKNEAELLRRPFVEKSILTLEVFIKRHGELEGCDKFLQMLNKRKSTKIARYGSVAVNGHVSKESFKFFSPLKQKLIETGINDEDIFWGFENKKEYFLKNNTAIFFYDFTILSKRVIIEYNNLFWHPRNLHEWKGFGEYIDKKSFDDYKNNTVIDNGFKLFIVWNDDDFEIKQREILEYINAR